MIGIFDSGIGGLTVVKEVLKQLPEYQILYFGDTARTPYGTKSEKTIIKYSLQNTEFLLSKGAKIIIIACNTASAVASGELKKKFKIPIFEVITPAVKKAIQATLNKKIGVVGTMATVKSGIYEKELKKIDKNIQIFSQSCPLLVPLVEVNWLKKPETKMIIRKYLYSLKLKQIDTLILGCTHYPLLKDIIQVKIGKRIKLVDPGQETVLSLKKYLEQNPKIEKTLSKNKNHSFYLSDLTDQAQEIGRRWLGDSVKFELINLD